MALPRLWCIAASNAPIVAVFARCYELGHWTCVLRWNWKDATIEEGAWTTMSVSARRCRLSPDGEFLFYHAKGSIEGPFSAFFGGAYAVSRLPWLSALTDPENWPSGGGTSQHALSERKQNRLWKIFEDWPANLTDGNWPAHLGDGWASVSCNDPIVTSLQLANPPHLAARRSLPDSELSLVAVVKARSGGVSWSVWDENLRFFVVSAASKDLAAVELRGARWASPAAGSRLLMATVDAKLRVLRFAYKEKDPRAAPTVEDEHDLSILVPRPGPSPEWARSS